MSEQVKRKITVNLTSTSKTLPKSRPSVFERLGTKSNPKDIKDFCHHWAQTGSCPYGKGCKYSATHILTSPSKQRAAKNQGDKRQNTKDVQNRLPSGKQPEHWNQWDPEELEDADPDDLEKRRQELQRELELQMKMENKAKKKDKKVKKESSPSSESSTTTSDSSSSSEESSSSSSSSIETRRKKSKKSKAKRDSSSSSEDRTRKMKLKAKRHSKLTTRTEKSKKTVKPAIKISTTKSKSPSPTCIRKQSQTPPLRTNIKQLSVKKSSSESKSPCPLNRQIDRKEKHRTPSPKLKEKERDKEKEREKEREREKDREREKERDKEKDKEREKVKDRTKERDRGKDKDYKKKESHSPKRELKSVKENKKRDTPDSNHSKDRKHSPSRSKGSSIVSKKDYKSPARDDRSRFEKRDERDRSKPKDRTCDSKNRLKDKRESRDRERERERERRIAREEREAAREKEREEALARCQERQRERERLKELAKKEEELRNRTRERVRREDRGLDKPSSERVERLLPLPEDRISSARKAHASECDRNDRRRDRTPDSRQLRKSSIDRHDRTDLDKECFDRNFDNRNYDRDHDREYGLSSRIRDEKSFESPFDNRNRRFTDIGDHYNDNSRDDRFPLDNRDYQDDRRAPRREMWNIRDEGDMDRETDNRRYGRDDLRQSNSMKGRDWDNEYNDSDWDRSRRPVDWENRDNWENIDQHKHTTEEEWRHYNRSLDSWPSDDRRRWPSDWRDRSRPCSVISANEDSNLEPRKKETLPGTSEVVAPPIAEESSEIKKEVDLKRVAEQPIEGHVEAKRPCIKEAVPVLEDDLSEISDDADEILNRDEEILESVKIVEVSMETTDCQTIVKENSTTSQKSQSPLTSPLPMPAKEESMDDENIDLDFEEISEDELEEELRVKGIGDALGVDWSSLLAESKLRYTALSSAKRRWESHNVLSNVGISVRFAGKSIIQEILKESAEKLEQELPDEKENIDERTKLCKDESIIATDITNNKDVTLKLKISHPVAVIQVAKREIENSRKNFFSSVGPFKRALSARRDLALRRYLCNLPENDAFFEPPKRHDPELFKIAMQLFERSI